MKELRKNITVDRLGNALSMTFFAFLVLMTWIVLGLVAFAVVFQWILLLFVPKEFYSYTMQAFITIWCIYGVWLWFFRSPKE